MPSWQSGSGPGGWCRPSAIYGTLEHSPEEVSTYLGDHQRTGKKSQEVLIFLDRLHPHFQSAHPVPRIIAVELIGQL